MVTFSQQGMVLWRTFIVALMFFLPEWGSAQMRGDIDLHNDALQLSWQKTKKGYRLADLKVHKKDGWRSVPSPSGWYTVLYAADKPSEAPISIRDKHNMEITFPEEKYRYITPIWKQVTSSVEMNTAGSAVHFLPRSVDRHHEQLVFSEDNRLAAIRAAWSLDERFQNDILVTMTLTAKKAGYYSLSSPTLAALSKQHLQWASVPGVFQGNAIEPDFIRAFAYGQGIPDKPVVVRERTVSTLSPLVTTADTITFAVIPDPKTGRDPWKYDKKTQSDWLLGLSVMNRKAELSPTVYHPVLGEKQSFLKAGESVSFSFRYTVQPQGWYPVFKHAINDIYRFKDFLKLKKARQSLTDRLLGLHNYVVDDSLSKWRLDQYNGMTIGAQDYLGGVYGSERDALKNSDYGAMWMLAKISDDSILRNTRLPYARNFKLAQQNKENGFFYGAAAGQYYLNKSKRFTEEWGPYSEPIGLTYYMMMDIGNILLFEPGDKVLKDELRLAADKLLAWMGSDGRWQVAYDNHTGKALFTDLEDLRPTFYGMVIAYKVLHEAKYLQAAMKGADWYIQHAVDKGRFLGVCGDTRFMPDFATGQSVQALLDLFDLTQEEKYKEAAVAAARIYTASIYTHPIPTSEKKVVNGVVREDWEISQAGLSFEHGGVLGSANHHGPILLASHAGMFVRLFAETRDSLFLDMARAAALGRDAFVEPRTNVASYYWDAMNNGAGPFPHHAWWQIGWITDYLLSEIKVRSLKQIDFPGGFITPKVGPHQSYGFTGGTVYGTQASLLLKAGVIHLEDPYVDYFMAANEHEKKLFVMLLNNDDERRVASFSLDYSKVWKDKQITPVSIFGIDEGGSRRELPTNPGLALPLEPYGLQTIEIRYK
ncbi:glycerophosphoryl diester phosphodiesterase [Arcticibacter tournemirensis]|nr:glycerophosphoryl diester phosphodiesterase [Arcticibacter tournemirensis]